jgi:hypothetical protein
VHSFFTEHELLRDLSSTPQTLRLMNFNGYLAVSLKDYSVSNKKGWDCRPKTGKLCGFRQVFISLLASSARN